MEYGQDLDFKRVQAARERRGVRHASLYRRAAAAPAPGIALRTAWRMALMVAP